MKTPAGRRAAGAKWHSKNREHALWLAARNRARLKNLECSLTLEQVKQLLAPMVCEATGLELKWEWTGTGKYNPWAPSLDRLNNSLGYIAGNVRVVCWAYNKARSDWPDEVFDTVAMAYARRQT